MAIFKSKQSKNAVVTSIFMFVFSAIGIGTALYMSSMTEGSLEIRSQASESTEICSLGETTACTTTYGTCTVDGTETCDANGNWGGCKAVDPRLIACLGKECGSDGCGGTCGTCGSSETCSTEGYCESSNSQGGTTPKTIQVKFNLQGKTNYTKSQVLLELYSNGKLVSSTNVSSNETGLSTEWDVTNLLLGTFTLRVKPYNYLSQTEEITLTANKNYVEFENEFLAGDLMGGTNGEGDDVIKSMDLAFLDSKLSSNNVIADLNGNGTVEDADRVILQNNLLKQGSIISE